MDKVFIVITFIGDAIAQPIVTKLSVKKLIVYFLILANACIWVFCG